MELEERLSRLEEQTRQQLETVSAIKAEMLAIKMTLASLKKLIYSDCVMKP